MQAIVYRKIRPVESTRYTCQFHQVSVIEGDDATKLAEQCYQYSLDSNESLVNVDPNLYFTLVDDDGAVMIKASPAKNKLDWSRLHFV